ncbi:VIT and vWA domain-containing protein [Telluria beijingensis]|uniref:VIT and vWA domain-containing protein n=1 Tax=Telluria beijingensis TaxID=3068633 RepID=UPI0027954D51|nr:VIT and VWA domain-containing protein [Massilia sp. REN29]
MSLTSLIRLNESQPSSQVHSRRAPTPPVLQSLRAEGTVHGLLLEMHVEHTYLNPGTVNIEAVYTFPLPVDAVLLGLEFDLGGRILRGKVVASGDAEEQYEAALENGDSAVLLERATDGVYTASVGNLLGREQAVVRIRYAQLLSFCSGQVRITIPNVIAPRHGEPSAARLRLHQVPAHDVFIRHPFSVSVRLHGPLAGGRISSPSHALAVRHTGEHLDVGLAQPGSAMLDRDFVLLCDGLEGRSIATVGRDADGAVAVVSFCPAPRTEQRHRPLNLKILVDCSNSMNGDSIKGARKALHEILAQLNPGDRFSYSRFGGQVTHHSNSLMAASARAIAEAGGWISQTAADMGNTDIRHALLSTVALGQPGEADIFLITDGHVWDTDPLVASATRMGQRIFAVGVGAAPAASLLQRLARETGGACELVGANDDVHAAVLRMFRRMRQAPVRDVAVTWGGACVWQSDVGTAVFSGDTVHACAGFADSVPGAATIAWTDSGENVQEQAMLPDSLICEGDTLARVAAAFRLRTLPAEQQHALALKYQLVTATTSMLVIHERMGADRPATPPVLRVVPQMHAAGHGGFGAVGAVKGPAVWRREPTTAQIHGLTRNGGEAYDVPAFLRKQERVTPYLYREQLRAFLYMHAALLQGEERTVTFAEVEDVLPDPVLRRLRDLAELGHAPQEVLYRFIVAVHGCFYRSSLPVRLFERLLAIGRRSGQMSPLDQRIHAVAREAYHATRPATADIPAFLRKQAD